jgi:3-oxoacyl-[acyl-carrier-protein] synthase II
MPAEEAERMGRGSQLAIASARMALEQAGLVGDALERYAAERRAVSFGTTMGEPEILDQIVSQIVAEGIENMPYELAFPLPSFRMSNLVARAFNFQGRNFQIPTACTAGNYAIGYGADLLRGGQADVVVAGGSDAFSRIAFVGFNKLLATASECVRPFDRDREGMIVSEGSGALVLERMDEALARGATVLAEFLDYGLGCDAHKMTIPHPEARGGSIAMRQALARSGLKPENVDYVSAHGTGTRENDKVETRIVSEVLGDHAKRLKISSIKSMLGHTMGAASAIEAVTCVRTLNTGWIAPTMNYQTPDPDCDLDVVPNQACQADVKVAVSNAYAFGGNCSTITLRRYEPGS